MKRDQSIPRECITLDSSCSSITIITFRFNPWCGIQRVQKTFISISFHVLGYDRDYDYTILIIDVSNLRFQGDFIEIIAISRVLSLKFDDGLSS